MDMQRTRLSMIGVAPLLARIGVVGAAGAAAFKIFETVAELGGLTAAIAAAAHATQTAIVHSYAAAPALVLVIAFLMTLPVVAGLQPVLRYVQRSSDATRRVRSSEYDAGAVPVAGDRPQLGAASAHAFVEVVGATQTRFEIMRDMLRIGREDDNDIRIPSAAVHRYHAAIYREHSDDWHIADLSGIEGNGIRVNGQRCSDARLSDGDVIELGPGRLRFRAALHDGRS